MQYNGLTGAGSDSAREEAAAQGRAFTERKPAEQPAPQAPAPKGETDADGAYRTIMSRPDSVFSNN